MKLHHQLVRELPRPLSAVCRLPTHYPLDLISDRRVCPHCQGRLRRVRTSLHFPVGLMLGQPRVRLIHRQCVRCGQPDVDDRYRQLVPVDGNYAYDLIVEIGLSRFRDHRQDREIQHDVRERWNLALPASSIGLLAHAFLDGLAAVHQAHAPQLRQRMAADGGYALHLDGTCEVGTDVAFATLASPRGWTLKTAKMSGEIVSEIRQILARTVTQFGLPLAVMRDLSPNIAQAKRDVLPDILDLICHYHFLENVGTKLCEKPHAKLTAALRRLKIRPALGSLRKDLVRYSRQAEGLSTLQINELLVRPRRLLELDPVTARRFVAYVLLRWLDDFGADLHGEYFPFDLPSLAFYRRGRQLEELLRRWLARAKPPSAPLSTLRTIARKLAELREDPEVVEAAQRLEKASTQFEELRAVLRLSSRPDEPLLRGRAPREDRQIAETLRRRLDDFRDRLSQRLTQQADPDLSHDQQVVLDYLRKYERELVGHVILLPGRREPFVVLRTNNVAEHLFGSTKRGLRRKVGAKKLTRHVQAMRAEELLVANLSDPEYVKIVCEGSLDHLGRIMARHGGQAQAIRRERRQPRTDHPLPTTKKQLRHPQLLARLGKLVGVVIKQVSKKLGAA